VAVHKKQRTDTHTYRWPLSAILSDRKCTFTMLLFTSSRTVPARDVLTKCADSRYSYFKGTCFANCRTLSPLPLGQMFLRVGALAALGLRAQTSALYTIVLDFWFFALFLNHSTRNVSGVRKRGKSSHFLTPCKIGEDWWGCLYEVFVPYIDSKHRYTFYRAAIGGLVTQRAVV